ncbi:MAG TPA: hypothetical protein VFR29_09220 [Steroidobacteraceae bacterium]|nr:hypothetical protein [Steroidobacteraceae bacterium]
MQHEVPPWLEKLQQPRVLAGIAGLVLVLVLALIWIAWRWGIAEDRYEMLQQQAAVGFLQAPSSARSVRIDPRQSPVVGIGGGGFPQRVDLMIAAATSNYDRFRISISRDDGTLVLHADRMARDSNNDLRVSFNTSLLPAGRYRIRIEGYARNGDLQPFEEVSMQVAGRSSP